MAVQTPRQILRVLATLFVLFLAAALVGTDELEALLSDEPESEIGESTKANEQPDGTIDRVIDGDTLDVVVAGEVVRVRLIGIDTPETVDPRKEVECFGQEASQHLKDLLADQVVTLEYDESQGREDKYGRELVYVILDDGMNVAEMMLRDGFAYEYTYNKIYEYQKVFKIAEQDARDNERGLWSSESCGGNR